MLRHLLVKRGFLFFLSLGLCYCAGNPAPISSRQQPPSILITHHIVEKGDTLFSIAWRYEKDFQKLAAVNGLQRPYTLYPGQRLNLDTSGYIAKPTVPNPTVPIISKPASSATRPPLKTDSTRQSHSSTSRPAPVLPGKWKWQWPVKGRVTRTFGSDNYFKGIDISSLPGAPVYPAAPGVVVYSGTGLRGYGHLIIIKHSDIYLSAYAHNRKVLVKEGEQVTQQQKVAEVGGDPANSRRFYFEIRKDGKPVNPLQYLP